MVEKVKLLWNPQNKASIRRGPSVMTWEKEEYLPTMKNGQITVEVPMRMAQFLLGDKPSKFQLLFPKSLLVNTAGPFGVSESFTVKAVGATDKPAKPKPTPPAGSAAKAKKAQLESDASAGNEPAGRPDIG